MRGLTNLKPVVNAGALALVMCAGMVSAQQPLPPVPVPMPALLKNYTAVTADRLTNPGDGDWLMVRRTYDGWG